MDNQQLDTLVRRVIKQLKEVSEETRQVILGGGLDQRRYDTLAGYLNGLEVAALELKEVAKTFWKEEIGEND